MKDGHNKEILRRSRRRMEGRKREIGGKKKDGRERREGADQSGV